MAKSTTEFTATDQNFSATVDSLKGKFDEFGAKAEDTANEAPSVGGAFVGAFTRVLVIIGLIVAAIAAMRSTWEGFKESLDQADEIDKLARKTKLLRADLVLLQQAFENTGTGSEKLVPIINKLRESVTKAGDNSSKAAGFFKDLGLEVEELQQMGSKQMLETVIKALDKMPDKSEAARIALGLFGAHLADDIIPLLNGNFKDAFEKALTQLGSFPDIISRYGPALNDLHDNFETLGTKLDNMRTAILAPIADGLNKILDQINQLDFSAVGLQVGKALQLALFYIAEFAIAAGDLLAGLFDGLAPQFESLMDAFTIVWAETVAKWLPLLQPLWDAFDNYDFYQLGKNLGDSVVDAWDWFLGAVADPSKGWPSLLLILDALFLKAADSFLTALVNAFNTLAQIQKDVFSNVQFWKEVGNLLLGALEFGIAQGGIAALSMTKQWIEKLGALFNAASTLLTDDWAEKLFKLVTNFAKDIVKALTNPFAAVADGFVGALISGGAESADTFQSAYNAALGGVLDKGIAGFEAMADEGMGRIESSATNIQGILGEAMNNAVTKSTEFESNIFGSKEALIEAGESARELADKGAEYRQNLSDAADEINDITANVQTVSDLTSGPEGIATKTREAADATSKAAGELQTTFREVKDSGQVIKDSINESGASLKDSVNAAGDSFNQKVSDAVVNFKDAMQGVASESTLNKAVNSLELLVRKLPQPVIA